VKRILVLSNRQKPDARHVCLRVVGFASTRRQPFNRSNVHGAERFEFVVGYRFLRAHTRDEAVVATLLRPPGIRFSSRVRSGATIVNSAVSSNGVWGRPTSIARPRNALFHGKPAR
jgi:hypothetical protein